MTTNPLARAALGLVVSAMLSLGVQSATPPLPPLPVSPVATFRNLLAMSPADRVPALQERPEKQRALLQARLAEYDTMTPARREDLLRATDLYWHLQQLVRRAPAERPSLLAGAPAELRPVLVERLALWDNLSSADQEALLQHERAIRYLARLREAPQPTLPPVTTSRAASDVLRLQVELAPFQGLSGEELDRIHRQWQQFFEAPAPRSRRTLEAMSAGERREMHAVLDRFKRLSDAQRQICIDAFARLAVLPPAERAAFLQSAERWEALSMEERETWRRVITKLPPLPPAAVSRLRPPLPPGTHAGERTL